MPTLFVDDVEASSRWYQRMLGAESMHGGPDFEMLSRNDAIGRSSCTGAEADEHGDHRIPAGAPQLAVACCSYCEVADVRAMHRIATEMEAVVESEPTFIVAAGHTEFVVHDPDGYAARLLPTRQRLSRLSGPVCVCSSAVQVVPGPEVRYGSTMSTAGDRVRSGIGGSR